MMGRALTWVFYEGKFSSFVPAWLSLNDVFLALWNLHTLAIPQYLHILLPIYPAKQTVKSRTKLAIGKYSLLATVT